MNLHRSLLTPEVSEPVIYKKRQPVAVSSILKSALRNSGLDKKLARYEFAANWNEIVGDEIAKRAHPERFRGKTLIVRVCDSVWAQELSFHKFSILTRLKRYLGKGQVVDDISFIVGK